MFSTGDKHTFIFWDFSLFWGRGGRGGERGGGGEEGVCKMTFNQYKTMQSGQGAALVHWVHLQQSKLFIRYIVMRRYK